MDTAHPHTSQETLALEASHESAPGAYEPPSITELGSFLELTAGGAQAGTDTDTASFFN